MCETLMKWFTVVPRNEAYEPWGLIHTDQLRHRLSMVWMELCLWWSHSSISALTIWNVLSWSRYSLDQCECTIKILLRVTFFSPCPLCFFIATSLSDRMGQLPIPSVIHSVTNGIMINWSNNGGNDWYGLKNITCKQTFMVDSHWSRMIPTPVSVQYEHFSTTSLNPLRCCLY